MKHILRSVSSKQVLNNVWPRSVLRPSTCTPRQLVRSQLNFSIKSHWSGEQRSTAYKLLPMSVDILPFRAFGSESEYYTRRGQWKRDNNENQNETKSDDNHTSKENGSQDANQRKTTSSHHNDSSSKQQQSRNKGSSTSNNQGSSNRQRNESTKGFTTDDPYRILGVDQSATAKEIKRAYFECAKLYHPDLHPDDPAAALKFQQVADAYEILGNAQRRKEYDMFGKSGMGASPSGQGDFGEMHADATKVFKQVWKDLGLHELDDYFDEVRQDMSDGLEALRKQDYDTALQVADRHKGLIVTTLVPLALIVRFPGAMLGVLRFGFGAAIFALRLLPPNFFGISFAMCG